METPTNDTTEIEEQLFARVAEIAGPEYRSLEENADGRGVMQWRSVLSHEGVEIDVENVDEMAEVLVEARNRMLEKVGDDRNFVAHYMEA